MQSENLSDFLQRWQWPSEVTTARIQDAVTPRPEPQTRPHTAPSCLSNISGALLCLDNTGEVEQLETFETEDETIDSLVWRGTTAIGGKKP